MKTRLLIIPVIAVAAVAIFFAVDSANLDRLCAEQGGTRDGDICMIEVPETNNAASAEHYQIVIPENSTLMHYNVNDDYITIGTGSKVTWYNDDFAPMTINSDDPDNPWSTGVILPDEYSTITFNKTGVYTYHGKPWITGTIVVMGPYDELDDVLFEEFSLDDITTMKPDSVKMFYYPNPQETENRDAFDRYMIIRLPLWLGGNASDASAYRIYSAKSTDDSCLVRYWPGDERQRIENPCKGGFYRVYDGVFTLGFGSVPNTNPVALPYLEVSSDQNGFLFVEPPTFSKDKNGVIGYGRQVSMQEIADGSQFYIDSFAKYNPEYPPIPKNFAGLLLAEIAQVYNGAKITYTDFKSVTNIVEMTISKCNCSALYMTFPYETLGEINGVTVAVHDTISQNPKVNESTNKYYFRFAHDGFNYEISGKYPDSIRKSIVSMLTNYVTITPDVGKTGTYGLEYGDDHFDVAYSITGASIENISKDDASNSLIISLDAVHPGSLEIAIPRDLHDAKSDYCPPKKENPPDDPFVVLVDGIEVAYDEIKTTDVTRTLRIPLTEDTATIEIIGMCLV